MPISPPPAPRPAVACAALLLAGCLLPSAPAKAQADALQAQVAKVARDWLSARTKEQGIQATQLDVNVVAPAKRPAPCAQPWQIDILKAMPGRVLIAVDCPSGSAGQSRYIARTTVHARVVVARTGIPSGHVLTADMLDTTEQDISLTPDVVTDITQVLGQRVLRPVGAGKLLQTRFLASEHGVRRGQPVRIVAGAPDFQISIAGTALADAGPGESVMVRNHSTGKALTARVSGDGIVSLVADAQ